jgi:hypothetical protein
MAIHPCRSVPRVGISREPSGPSFLPSKQSRLRCGLFGNHVESFPTQARVDRYQASWVVAKAAIAQKSSLLWSSALVREIQSAPVGELLLSSKHHRVLQLAPTNHGDRGCRDFTGEMRPASNKPKVMPARSSTSRAASVASIEIRRLSCSDAAATRA